MPSRANPGYGLSWWLLRSGLIAPGRRAGVEVDPTLEQRFGPVSMAAGAGDQRLYIIREHGLVIARQATGILAALLGRASGPRWNDSEFLRTLLTSA